NEIEREENFVEVQHPDGRKEYLLCGDCMELNVIESIYPELYGDEKKVKKEEVSKEYEITEKPNAIQEVKVQKDYTYLYTLEFTSPDQKNEFNTRDKTLLLAAY